MRLALFSGRLRAVNEQSVPELLQVGLPMGYMVNIDAALGSRNIVFSRRCCE